MIKKVYISELDRHNLSKNKTQEGEKRDRVDYKNVVVKKPWGYEYLMYENDFVAIWILHLEKGHATSMHCHPRKKTSLVVLSGTVHFSTLTEWIELRELDGIVIENGVFHSSKAVSDDVFIMEIESPPNKKDLVRLNDAYGREGKKYEGKSKMTRKLRAFKHVYFKEKDIEKSAKKVFNKVMMQMKYCRTNQLDKEIGTNKGKKIYTMLEEKVVDLAHKQAFSVGDVFTGEHVGKFQSVKMYNNTLLFSVELI